MGKIQKPEEFDEVVVATRGNYQVKVKDLGYIEDGAEELRSEARLNGQPAVTLDRLKAVRTKHRRGRTRDQRTG